MTRNVSKLLRRPTSKTFFTSQGSLGIVRSKFPDVQIPANVSLPDFIWKETSVNHGDKLALVDAITGKSLTFREAAVESKKFCNVLKDEFRTKKGDVIGFYLNNRPEYITSLTGAIGAGAAVTTVNPSYTVKELSTQMSMSGAKIVVTTAESLEVVRKSVGEEVEVVLLDAKISGTHNYEEMIGQAEGEVEYAVDPDGTAMLPYSSGTTGLPKGVVLTSGNIIANVAQSADSRDLDYITPATDSFQSKTVCIMPMFHAFGTLVTSLPTLRCGGQVVTLPKFDPKTFVGSLEKHKPTFLHLAPPVVAFLANSPDVKPHHLESVQNIVVAAAPFGETLAKKYLRKAPHTVFKEAWGMTELSPLALVTPSDRVKIGSCGVPVPNTEAKIVDGSGRILGAGEKGELCIRGPQVMKGYLNNEEATLRTIKDGWLHSGDVAMYDEDDFFFIVDRLKELIKVKGFQVAPAELEDLMRSHPDILDVGVIGVPDERKGEAPFAFVVPQPNSNISKEAIKEFVEKNAAPYKHLTGGVEFVKSIPKTASGKILRRELRKLKAQ